MTWDLENLATTDDDIFLEADERLRLAIDHEGENRAQAVDDLNFEDGFQWPDDLYNQRKISRRPTLTINMTRRCVREVMNNMRQQRPRIKVHPTGEGAKIEDARVISGLIRHIENLSKASVAYDTAGESAVKMGWGYWRILSEYLDETSFDQELKIRAIRNPMTVYDDPLATLPTGADRDWLFITEEMKRTRYKQLYPKAVNAEWLKGGSGDDRSHLWESRYSIRLAEYYRIAHKPTKLYKLNNGKEVLAKDFNPQKEALEAQGIVPVDDRKTFIRQVQWFRLNGREIVDRRELPGRWIPVVRVEGNCLDVEGRVRRRGMVRDLKDVNRMLNYWTTCETELVALAPRAPFIAAEGQLNGHPEWKDANQKPYSSLIYNIIHTNPEDMNSPVLPPPMRQEAVQIPAGVVNARQGAMQDLMALAGMPHEPRADLPGSVVSGKALRERQAQSDRSHFQYYDNQTQAIAHTGEILLNLIPHYYSTARMQRIIGEDGVPEMVGINQRQPGMGPDGQAIWTVKNDLTVGRYDVVMDTGPGYETKRQEQAEQVVDLLKVGPLADVAAKAGADLIFRYFDMDDMADRVTAGNPQQLQKVMAELPPQARNIVQSLQGQLQQAQQLLQRAQMELKYKGSIESGWMDVEREKIRTQSATKIEDTHVQAVTKHDVAEIQAGAKIIDSHVKGAHDLEQAREMASKAANVEKSNGK